MERVIVAVVVTVEKATADLKVVIIAEIVMVVQ